MRRTKDNPQPNIQKYPNLFRGFIGGDTFTTKKGFKGSKMDRLLFLFLQFFFDCS
jgi:hypothetical protein